MIAGELELHRADASPQRLQQGDGLGITGTAPAPCNLLGLTPGADVLLFAMTTTAEDLNSQAIGDPKEFPRMACNCHSPH